MTPTLLLAAVLGATSALADDLRLGIFVGNNQGSATDLPLLFAVSDARKMRDLFVEYGQIRSGDALLLEEPTRHQVQAAFDSLHSKIVNANNNGDHTTLVFYYSGHGDDQALRLGTTRIAHEELRRWLENAGSDVRLALLDACHSGGAIRTKGGTRGPAFEFAVQVEQTHGTAVLTSSAASELSQESAQMGGGFFTHYLHTALLGAADANHNGEVSLPEAYSYVRGETALGTHITPGTQTPSYDYDMGGAGDVVLTTLEKATAHLSFTGGLDGVLSVWDDSRRRYVAEVDGDHTLSLAIRPGDYFVHRRMPGWVDEAAYTVRRGETHAVYSEDFVRVAYEDTAARGELDKQVRRASLPKLSLRAAFGGRAWGGNYGSQYLPSHGLVGVEARFLRTGRTWFAFDLLSGAGSGTLQFEELGPLVVTVGSTSVGAAVGFSTRPGLLRAGVGGKSEGIAVRRTFPDGAAGDQVSASIAVGATGFVGLYHGRFSADLNLSLLWMATRFDNQDELPVFFEPVFAIGYRF